MSVHKQKHASYVLQYIIKSMDPGLREIFTHCVHSDVIFSQSLETSRDGVIELYEFIDLVMLYKELTPTVTTETYKRAVHEIRMGRRGVQTTGWWYTEDGVCEGDVAARDTLRDLFKDIDKNADGVVTRMELRDYINRL